MKFLVPNYSCIQNPWLGGLPTPDPRSLCHLSSTEFVETPLPRKKFLGTPLVTEVRIRLATTILFVMIGRKQNCNFTGRYKMKLNSSLNCDVNSARLRFFEPKFLIPRVAPMMYAVTSYEIFINRLGLQIIPFDFLFVLCYSKFFRIWPNNGRCWFNQKKQ
jgi:hypothetical protein